MICMWFCMSTGDMETEIAKYFRKIWCEAFWGFKQRRFSWNSFAPAHLVGTDLLAFNAHARLCMVRLSWQFCWLDMRACLDAKLLNVLFASSKTLSCSYLIYLCQKRKHHRLCFVRLSLPTKTICVGINTTMAQPWIADWFCVWRCGIVQLKIVSRSDWLWFSGYTEEWLCRWMCTSTLARSLQMFHMISYNIVIIIAYFQSCTQIPWLHIYVCFPLV